MLVIKNDHIHLSFYGHLSIGIYQLGEPSKFFSEKVGHLAQQADAPPRKLGRQKKKKKFNVYFAFYAIQSILFFPEKFHFFGWDNELGGPRPS